MTFHSVSTKTQRRLYNLKLKGSCGTQYKEVLQQQQQQQRMIGDPAKANANRSQQPCHWLALSRGKIRRTVVILRKQSSQSTVPVLRRPGDTGALACALPRGLRRRARPLGEHAALRYFQKKMHLCRSNVTLAHDPLGSYRSMLSRKESPPPPPPPLFSSDVSCRPPSHAAAASSRGEPPSTGTAAAAAAAATSPSSSNHNLLP